MNAIEFMMENGEAGQMILTRANIEGKDETIFIIKEEDKYIKRLGYSPVFDLRSGMFAIDNVIAVVILMEINLDKNMLYESFYNYLWKDNEGEEIFNDLTKQDRLMVIFINTKGETVRKIQIKNGIKELLIKGEDTIKSKKWSMKEFDSAKEHIYRMYPTPEILFGNLH